MPPTDGEIKLIQATLNKIVTLLQGNDLDKDDNGLIGTVNEIDERLIKLEKLRDKISWVVFGMALPAGYGITKILAAISEAIHK